MMERVAKLRQRLSQHAFLGGMAVVIVVSGCSRGPRLILDRPHLSPPTIEIEAIEAGFEIGSYRVEGNATLPDGARLWIIANRTLTVEGSLPPSTHITTLDRQLVEVLDGQWQALLTLYQPNEANQLLEPWQQDTFTFSVPPTPADSAIFQAILDVDYQRENFFDDLEEEGYFLSGPLGNFTPTGQYYFGTSTALAILPPDPNSASLAPPRQPTPPPRDPNRRLLPPEAYVR